MWTVTTKPQSTASAGNPTVMGSLDKALVTRVIRAHLGLIKQCVSEHLASDGGVSRGKLVVKFVISATGTVSSSKVAQTTLANEAVERCVASAVQAMTFPPPRGGGVAIVDFPFELGAP